MAKKNQDNFNKNQRIKKAKFIAAYAKCGIIGRAAEIVGIYRMTPDAWAKKDKAFAQSMAEAYEDAMDVLEEEARRRAVDGLRKMKFHQGVAIIDPETNQPYVEHEYSDNLLMFKLKAGRPEKFRDNVDITSGGKPLPVKIIRGVSMDDL